MNGKMGKKTALQVPSVISPLQKGTIRSRSQLHTIGVVTEKPSKEGPGLPECSSMGMKRKETRKTQHIFYMLDGC